MKTLYLIYIYIKRIVTNSGPHGKYCKCKKWGSYVSLGCANPGQKFHIEPPNNFMLMGETNFNKK